MCLGLSAQPQPNGWTKSDARHCVPLTPSSFTLRFARLGFCHSLAACPRLCARVSAVVTAASPGPVVGQRIGPRPPLYTVSPSLAIDSLGDLELRLPPRTRLHRRRLPPTRYPRIPRRRSLTGPDLSPTTLSCRFPRAPPPIPTTTRSPTAPSRCFLSAH